MYDQCLSELDGTEDYYTWSNKHLVGTIYSRVDRVIRNVDWFQNHLNTTLKIVSPYVSDHAMLYLSNQITTMCYKRFRFVNCITEVYGFKESVKDSWNAPMDGRPMYVLWKKL